MLDEGREGSRHELLSPVTPGASSSVVEAGSAELLHPVHSGDGVVPAVPPPPRQNTCTHHHHAIRSPGHGSVDTRYLASRKFVESAELPHRPSTTNLIKEHRCQVPGAQPTLTLLSVIQGWYKHCSAVNRF